MADLIGGAIAFLVTLTVLSYVFLEDWAFFRWVMHIFIGAAAGYAGAVALRSILLPMLLTPILRQHSWITLIPLVLALLMLLKIFPGKTGRLGNISVAFLVGTGAAAAVGGAVTGTIFPQVGATTDAFNLALMRQQGIGTAEFLVSGAFMLIGTVAALAYFHFSASAKHNKKPTRPGWINALAKLGEWFIAVTFGALFAGVYLAAITSLAVSASNLWQYLILLLHH